MNTPTREYTNGEITVVWRPTVCIHSRLCFHNLPQVFDPSKRPWVTMSGATTDRIIERVDGCPSGALSYFRNAEATTAAGEPAVAASSVVEFLPDGPLLVYGNLLVKDTAGNETHKSKVTAFCRCGLSHSKPYCDGSHVAGNFKG